MKSDRTRGESRGNGWTLAWWRAQVLCQSLLPRWFALPLTNVTRDASKLTFFQLDQEVTKPSWSLMQPGVLLQQWLQFLGQIGKLFLGTTPSFCVLYCVRCHYWLMRKLPYFSFWFQWKKLSKTVTDSVPEKKYLHQFPKSLHHSVWCSLQSEVDLVVEGVRGKKKITCHVSTICPATICHPPLSETSSSLSLTGCPAVRWAGPVGHNGGRIWKGQYISWTLIGWLTFTMLPSGMGQRTSEGERRREIRLWAIRLMKEGNGVKGQEKVALRQISLEESRTDRCDGFRVRRRDTDWQRRNKSRDALSLGERITLNVLF